MRLGLLESVTQLNSHALELGLRLFLLRGMMSGSSDALLRHRPLRTVRASFPAYGSSLYKFTIYM
ncbi:hypothetical protein V130003_02500 [Vibrio cholerae]|nr:hypothetical protein DN34_3305 [Vibrio cholerae]BCZ99267.1 hypothetical protein V130003_02500 [Vibrio cholerae]